MDHSWTGWLERWSDAGLIDGDTAARIRAFEAQHGGSTRLRWPILIALAFGGLMVCGGILLFVAANWDALSPTSRFALVLLLVASFHVGGAALAEKFPAMSETFHAVGTIALGSGIALAGQIFNLEEHWPGGIMMWALGAALAWWLLRHTAQMILVAILAPAWLVGEWLLASEAIKFSRDSEIVAAAGVFLLALAYLSAAGPGRPTSTRRALRWLGVVGVIIAAPVLVEATWINFIGSRDIGAPTRLLAVGWILACAVPLAVAGWLRGLDCWPQIVATGWVVVLAAAGIVHVFYYGWWALGAVGLVAWGVRDGRPERVYLGALFFAITVLAFYFSRVMDKLGRSASLVGLGLLFLVGGWALERIRRQMVLKAKEAA
jgi:uncharacterized membrane protein